MKLSDIAAKLTYSIRNLNGTATRALGIRALGIRFLGIAALAGAALATVPAAQAQHFAVGVQFGGPRYYAPLPPPRRFVGPAYGYGYGPGPGYWEHRRYEDFRRHEWFAHHGGYYGRPY